MSYSQYSKIFSFQKSLRQLQLAQKFELDPETVYKELQISPVLVRLPSGHAGRPLGDKTLLRTLVSHSRKFNVFHLLAHWAQFDDGPNIILDLQASCSQPSTMATDGVGYLIEQCETLLLRLEPVHHPKARLFDSL